jgi:hypothetical protein
MVNRGEQLTSFRYLVLLLPQASQTRRCAQFPRFGLLLAGDVKSVLETGFGVRALVWGLLQQQFPCEAMEFGFVEALCTVCARRRSGSNPATRCSV